MCSRCHHLTQGRDACLGVAVLGRQDGFGKVGARHVLVQRPQVAQQRVQVAARDVLHHDLQVVLAGEAVVEAHRRRSKRAAFD